MQSYLQYRRLRRDVQEDIARAQQAKRLTPTGTSAPESTVGEYNEKNVAMQEPKTLGTTPVDADGQSQTRAASVDSPLVPGITVSRPDEGDDAKVVFLVGWKEDDPSDPQKWSMARKRTLMVTACTLCIVLTIPTSVDGLTQEAFNVYYGANTMAGSMVTGIYLIGIAVGSLFVGPLSETFGRNLIYISNMILVMLFIMGKALAPSYGAALAFRFLTALFAAAPMTVASGTMGDIWSPMQISFGLPFGTFCAYAGPILGPVIGAYTPAIGFAWADWISMILVGAGLVLVLLAQPEMFAPLLLEWRAKNLRDLTGDDRYHAEHASASSLGPRLVTNLYRPFTLAFTEPIILIFTFYLILLYFVLFTFLNGYPYIFEITYGVSNGITFIIWTAMLPGVVISLLVIPFIHNLTVETIMKAIAAGQAPPPEVSLYWAMAGASILMPISLFWMAWTCYPHISIWSPILASAVFGYCLVCIFTTTYMYMVFVYLQNAASALGFMTFARYLISGALSPASVKMYDNLGPHWALTIVAIIAAVMAPVPYVLHQYGRQIRGMSKNVQNKG